MVRRPSGERQRRWFNPRFVRSAHTRDLNISAFVTTLPGGLAFEGLELVGPVSVYCGWKRYQA